MPKWIASIFQRLRTQAEDHITNDIKQQELLESAERKMVTMRRGGMITDLIDDIKTLFQMVRAYSSGTYRDVPVETIIIIITAIIYFVIPIDMMPDFIPGGFFDDALIFTFVLNGIRGEIEVFRAWMDKKTEFDSKNESKSVK